MSVLDDLGRSGHVSLTTFRKDGTPVATPVWHVRRGDELVIISEASAWKVKRVRRDRRVIVTACSIRGRIAPGAPSAEGTARLLDDDETQAGRALLARRYVTSRIGNWFARLLRLKRPPLIGIAVSF